MHIFNAGGSARWGPVPFMKKTRPVTHRRVFRALALSNDSGASPSAYRLLSCLRRNSLSMT